METPLRETTVTSQGPTVPSNVGVLSEILTWSRSRPVWQRDALRRLVLQGDLTHPDIEALLRLCKAGHSLGESGPAEPLTSLHVPQAHARPTSVTLASVTHQGGVNALAPNQTIEFGPALTIVYGKNAAGKSGFFRILKRACRARGSESTILGNVLSSQTSQHPSATIAFLVDGDERQFALENETSGAELGLVSVFDAQCAAVYLTERMDVAFRPSGLDLFDKLAQACQALQHELDRERKELERSEVPLPRLPEGTRAQTWLSKLSPTTDLHEGRKLAALSPEEEKRRDDLRQRLSDLQAQDSRRLAEALNLKADRVARLGEQCGGVDDVLRADSLQVLFRSAGRVEEAERASRELQRTTLRMSPLPDTGSDLWRRLWEAARNFSVAHAYPTQHFPVAGGDARCVLCQQRLEPEAQQRLANFERFARSTIQQELEKRRREFRANRDALTGMVLDDPTIRATVDDLAVEEEALAGLLRQGLADAGERRSQAISALDAGTAMPLDLPQYDLHVKEVNAYAERLIFRSKALLRARAADTRNEVERELRELQAREMLGGNLDRVAEEVERQKRLARYLDCQRDTDTRRITLKSKDVTRRVVTDQLTTAFRGEITKLSADHLQVEMSESGGVRGVPRHQLVLRDAVGIGVERVASEGEARALSIASFFAEMSTSPGRSAILFDDPVSSLDHSWRDNVARRLVEEANTRQVIVFTHDIMFLSTLVHEAEDSGVLCKHQRLHWEQGAAGVTSPDLPWIAMRVRDRIGALKARWQRAEKLERTSTRESYEQEAIQIYGQLRETWERAIEEVLLGRIVERYRSSVQTKQLSVLVDISEEDCKTLEKGMTKCSRWLAGHDQPAADNSPVPASDELNDDIDALDAWVRGIRKRRRPASGTAQ